MRIEKLDYGRLRYNLRDHGMSREAIKLEKAHALLLKGKMLRSDYNRLYDLINKRFKLHLMCQEAKAEYQKELRYLFEVKDILLD